MTQDIGTHRPTDAFRSTLERRIAAAFHADLTPPSINRPAQTRWRDRLRVVALIAFGLVVGVGTQLASAQVAQSRQRGTLESAVNVERELAALRLSVAKLNEERAQRAFAAGVASRQSLLEAEAEVRAMELAVARIDLDLAEIRVTAEAPRDELWAPTPGSRDFVRERLQLAAIQAQQRLRAAEVALAEAERGARVGRVSGGAVDDARLDHSLAKKEFQTLAQRIALRETFLKERLSAEEVTRRSHRMELTFEIEHAQHRLQVAESRVAVARQRTQVGAEDELALKRAEIEVLQMRVELQRLAERLRAMEGRARED